MRFKSHQTFAIRKGWLHKGMRYVKRYPKLFSSKEKKPMDVLGIGSNMVNSLRYWLQATGLTYEEKGSQFFTKLGELIWANDPYFEEDGTLFLLHYNLAKGVDLSTSWYYFFSEFKVAEITQESFVASLMRFVIEKGQSINANSLGDDYDCILKTYLPGKSSEDPESNLDCPLADLGLLKVVDRKERTVSKQAPKEGALDPLIVLAVLLNELEKGQTEIKIADIEKKPGNIGRVFNLDSILVSAYLDKLQSLGYLRVIRTAGLDIVKFDTKFTFLECVEQYYKSISD